MESVNKYYFDLEVSFESKYDVSQLEDLIGLKPVRLISYENSVGPVKSGKYFYQTKEMNNIYTDDEFGKFVEVIKNHLTDLPLILKANNGKLTFYIVFTQVHEKPCISLNARTIKILAELGARFQIDYA